MIKVKSNSRGAGKALGLRKRPVDQWNSNFLGNSTKDIHSEITNAALVHFKVQ